MRNQYQRESIKDTNITVIIFKMMENKYNNFFTKINLRKLFKIQNLILIQVAQVQVAIMKAMKKRQAEEELVGVGVEVGQKTIRKEQIEYL